MLRERSVENTVRITRGETLTETEAKLLATEIEKERLANNVRQLEQRLEEEENRRLKEGPESSLKESLANNTKQLEQRLQEENRMVKETPEPSLKQVKVSVSLLCMFYSTVSLSICCNMFA